MSASSACRAAWLFRLRQSGDLAAGVLGDDVGDRRLDPGDLGRPVPVVLIRGHARRRRRSGRLSFQRAAAPAGAVPVALNSFGLWLALMIGLTVTNYGYPIAQSMVLTGNQRARGLCRSAAMSDAAAIFAAQSAGSARSVGVTAAIAVLAAFAGLDPVAAGAAQPQARRHLGRDLQRRRRAARRRRKPPRSSPTSRPPMS